MRRIASSSDYEQLADGESCLAIGYSGDAMIARRMAKDFASGNAAALAVLDPSMRSNSIVYPPAEVRARFAIERVYTPDELRTFNRAMAAISDRAVICAATHTLLFLPGTACYD